MTGSAMRRALLIALLFAGCEGPDFAPSSIVRAPRVIAAVATPAESTPGQDVRLSTVVASPDPVDHAVEWEIDLGVPALAAAAGQTLEGAPRVVRFEVVDGVARLPGEETRAAMDALSAAIDDAPLGTPEGVVRYVYETVGLTLLARFTLRVNGEIAMEGFKRIALSPAPSRLTNPPPPRFRVGEAWLSARSGDPTVCAPEGDVPRVAPGETVTLSPEPDEDWLETFPALDLEGQVITGREDAYYSWFSTAGDFGFETTRPPGRDTEWTAPMDPGEVPIWLVVRDGHLGASACLGMIRVE